MRTSDLSRAMVLPLALLSASVTTSSCAPSTPDDPVASGTFLVVVNTSNEIGYLLREHDGTYVRLQVDPELARGAPGGTVDWRTGGGSPVDVFGQVNADGSIAVEALRAHASGGLGESTSALLTRGGRRVLALRVQFDGGATMGTAADVTSLLSKTASYLAGASFDQLQLGYDVAGPFNIRFGSCDDYGRWMGDAKSAAASAGYDLTRYQHFMISGNMNCGYGGLGAQPGNETWIAGLWPEVVAHELGHNFGLWHASSRACTNAAGAAVPMSDTCTFSEYGDPFDTMGSGGLHHYNAVYKSNMGWIPADQIRTATGDQAYTLASETAAGAGLQLIRVRGAGDVMYSLELRQSSAADGYASSAAVTRGVLVHAFFTKAWDAGRSLLLDMVPGGDFSDAALPVGGSFTFPGTSITLRVQSISSSGAQIEITGAGAAPAGERLRALHSGKCLGLDFGSQEGLTQVVQRPCNGGADQDWLLVDAGGGSYNVKTVATGRCLDVRDSSTAEGASLIIWDCTGGANQKWTVTTSGAGVALRSQSSGKCAAVAGASTADAAPLVQATCAAVTQQQFKRGGGERLMNTYSTKCLGVEGASNADAAGAVQSTCAASTSLEWAFESLGNGAYALRNVASGKCLDVYGQSLADGAALVQWPCNGGTNQQWQPVASGSGIALRSVLSGKCVDDYNLSTAEGAKMVQWPCNGGAWQSFARQ